MPACVGLVRGRISTIGTKLSNHGLTVQWHVSKAALRHRGISSSGWTSHAMRRGLAFDVLEQHGIAAMLQAGDWNSAGAFAYASREHVEQKLFGQLFAHFSDDHR